MSRALALIIAVAATACLANDAGTGFIIIDNSAPPMGTCSFTGTQGQPAISSGTLDTASPTGYLFDPLLQSRLTTLMGQDPTSKWITVQGAKVTLLFPLVETTDAMGASTSLTPTVDPSLTNFQVDASGFLTPNGGTANVSFELVPWPLIPQLTRGVNLATQKFTAQIEAQVTMFGYEGHSNIDAEPFTFGVTLCNDCVATNYGMCPVKAASLPAVTTNPCNKFQDGAVNCCCAGHCSNAGTTSCGTAGDCGAGTCSITTTKTCTLPTDCVAGTDGVCVFPNTCIPDACTDTSNGLVCPATSS
jgi:hypothetical protein